MAETKTTIPVEIKMGNAGTNDANLPAFKEGSIIFTKDTKKIYIDPVGETERIEIGGTEVDLSGKQDKFADLDYVWDGNSFKYLSLNLKNAIKKTSSTGGAVSPVSDLTLSSEMGDRVYLTVGAITVDPIDNGRYSSGLSNTFLKFKDREASATLPSMLITPTAHSGTTPAYLTFASPAQNTAVGNANVRLTGIAAPTADNDAVNRGYLTTKYGSTYYESQDKQYYLPSGSNMVIPNSNMGRLFIGSESAASTDFKIYVNDPIDGGKLIITNLKTPTNNEDAANKAYVDTETAKKQGKFADISYENNIATNDKLVLTPNVDNAISEVYFNIDGPSDWKMGTKAVSAPYFKTKNGYIIANTSSMPPILMSNVTTQATTPIINFESAANNNATILRGIADGLNDNDAVNVSQLVKKQDKITNTTDLTVKSITALGVLKAQAYAPLDGQPSFQVFSGTIGQSSMFTFSDKKVVEFKKDSQAFSPSPMPVLGIATPISAADTTLGITDANLPYQAVNKKYVDDIKTELLNAITHPYTYDETTKELTLIL